MQDSEETQSSNPKRSRSPPVTSPQTSTHSQEKKRKTSSHEQQIMSVIGSHGLQTQLHNEHIHDRQNPATPDGIAARSTDGTTSVPARNTLPSASSSTSPSASGGFHSHTHTQTHNHTHTDVHGAHLQSAVSPKSLRASTMLGGPLPLEAINNRAFAELLISTLGNTSTPFTSSSSSSSSSSFSSSLSSSSSSSSLSSLSEKASEDAYYALLGIFLEHFERNDSALVWLSQALPTGSNKWVVPKTCRNPKSAAGNGGYADVFKKLGWSLKESDTRSGHWHYWFLDPISTNLRAVQAALKRRWEESFHYSESAAGLCKLMDENLHKRSLPLRRLSQPTIPLHAQQYYSPHHPPTVVADMPSAATHGPYFIQPSPVLQQLPQQSEYHPLTLPMQTHPTHPTHPTHMPTITAVAYVNPYSTAAAATAYQQDSSLRLFPDASGWHAPNSYPSRAEKASHTSKDGQMMNNRLQKLNHMSQEQSPLLAPHAALLSLPQQQQQQQLQTPYHQLPPQQSLHSLRAAIAMRRSSDHTPRIHLHSNSADSMLQPSHTAPWAQNNIHPQSQLQSNPQHKHQPQTERQHNLQQQHTSR